MIRKVTIATILFSSFTLSAQQQIGNSNMEAWDNVGAQTEEPTNWNSFKTAEGSLSSFGSQQIQRSTSIRSGATGSYCARIWSTSQIGIVANGNLTLGQINMGSSTPSSTSNYNYSKTADANFSEALTSSPDSLIFWAKFTVSGSNDSARVHAILHDSYDLRDPLDANSTPHVVARAERNYRTGGNWVRMSVPFVYEGPASTPAFILITFTTNKTPGGGTANDEVLIDDVELKYNTSGIEESNLDSFNAYYSVTNGLQLKGKNDFIYILNSTGSIINKDTMNNLDGIELTSGLYFIKSNTSTVKILVP